MTRLLTASAIALSALLAAPAAQAEEIVFGFGATDYSDAGVDGAAFSFEYKSDPIRQRRVRSLSWGLAAEVSEEGDIFVGGGIWRRWEWASGWFIDNSLMPGLYEAGTPANDLGSAFEIRSLLGVGYRFDNGGAISAAFVHKSNASLAEDNPGANTYLIRYHFAF